MGYREGACREQDDLCADANEVIQCTAVETCIKPMQRLYRDIVPECVAVRTIGRVLQMDVADEMDAGCHRNQPNTPVDMTKVFNASAADSGLSVKAYSGDHCVLLAFSLADDLTERLAGFAIQRSSSANEHWTWLGNRLNFAGAYTDPDVSHDHKFFPSNTAPFQKFWWIDFPPEDSKGSLRYEVIVRRFKDGNDDTSIELVDDQRVKLEIEVAPFRSGLIEVAFTRGYLSSQAYADKFHNAAFQRRQSKGKWNFATGPFIEQWTWLGGHARQAIIDFLNDCHTDTTCTLDACVYDLNEPDMINAFASLAQAGRLRLLADDARLHGPKSAHGQAFEFIRNSAEAEHQANFKRGKFGRFQHNKVLIKRDASGQAIRVLSGSTNFSVTGLYVNANHVVVFDARAVAAKYAAAFQAAFDTGMDASAFQKADIARSESNIDDASLPAIALSFAPHAHPTSSLESLLSALKDAESSVIFAVMELGGTSKVLETLRELHNSHTVFSYGISDNVEAADNTVNGTTVYTPDRGGELVYSKENPEKFPPPFNAELEVRNAVAHIVHHKFVVVDFNGAHPVVFGGSSNLAELGEELNGDNLFAIHDKAIATVFAIEGLRLVDHYAFAAALKRAEAGGKAPAPLCLKKNSERWYASYYQEGSIRQTERLLFTR
ncbi:phospholipase D-like domain-containing protein [Caballeronia sp. LZ033]|uniref:phospholipase D-like domain-containing protein n=1 Tax=Caballeronia sp. LZ033 TaxID=3038566 RepID=UPI002854EAD5|nr:phospholipase D-like domain-containing protein [Caballeronia sp. LZ033]MDR5816307.1 phospholipase D-like domain-containing protein [Caballeronia sp. LZ033]